MYDAAELCTRGFLWSARRRAFVVGNIGAGFGREVGENISATKHE
jgi:hypothetical protein